MDRERSFFNLYNHGFVRVAVGVPRVAVADPDVNAARTIGLLRRAAEERSAVALFPELGLSSYTCEDLFHQRALLDASQAALARVLVETRELPLVGVVGLPFTIDAQLFNCAAVFSRGRLLGIVPKSFLPNYREFYELRQFSPADRARVDTVALCGQRDVPFGTDLLFHLEDAHACTIHVEICEDLWVPVPPSSFAAMAGATLLLNLSASNVTIGKDAYRHQLVSNQSARCLAAYAYASAGSGESTTDLAWDGHGIVCENGNLIAESERFSTSDQLVVADVDLDRLTQERMRQNSFGQSIRAHRAALDRYRTIPVAVPLPHGETLRLRREYERFPYVPSDPDARDERCHEVYEIQVQGLVTRLEATGIEKAVVGVSGGLDSTQALLVAVRAMDRLGRPRENVIGCTMPGFATSERTLGQARELMRVVGCQALEIDIRPSATAMLEAIGHPHAAGQPVHDVTYENVQAGERTSHLFRLANLHRGLVVGTGDLSESALGWQTYGVGDHMSHYAVNASVPKTLIRYLIRWVAETEPLGGGASDVLRRILDTEVSPELVPGDAIDGGQPAQSTEASLGPFALHDFFLYYVLRFGYSPPKVAFLAEHAWHDAAAGRWPGVPEAERRAYSIGEIRRHLALFLDRFFRTSQFKRSAMPNAPKVGSGGSLSPRSDYRAPSDATARAWLDLLDAIPGEET